MNLLMSFEYVDLVNQTCGYKNVLSSSFVLLPFQNVRFRFYVEDKVKFFIRE